MEVALEQVLHLEEALAVVAAETARLGRPTSAASTPLGDAYDRVLAETVCAPRDQPPFDRSTRDGYAVRAADVQRDTTLSILGSVRAGTSWSGAALQPGQAVEIMTGAPLPPGADAVLMVEHTALAGGTLRPAAGRTLRAGDNVVPRGAEARKGAALLHPGQLLDPAAIALAASCGKRKLMTCAAPVVAILATGDELVEIDAAADHDATPADDHIFNSNSFALAALATREGAQPERLPVARDTMADLRLRLRQAATADLLLLSGGVSMGKHDLVEQALAEAGATFFFTGVRIQPGKPVVFGRVPRKGLDPAASATDALYFFGLPGNPVSTEVCFHLFVAPFLRALGGLREPLPRFTEATAAEPFEGKPNLVRFLPARVHTDWRSATVRPIAWQGSGDLAANARANAFCVVEPDGLTPGHRARVLLR